ncbi:hypothetical protein BJM32_06940 [Listeria monocytogenes]|uniref:hypothetical protein n=1 Tax=Listeria monocytogenes TaxID=1639 RepID=UPI00087415B1|nr:hypothetical protein [Listeria monocytogenes]EAD8851647.1 hypothetical protein [Listeria monocytogenes]OFF50983.1 hypothetical protein BJM32_06940 [Listeria monocytogenes]
MNNIEITLTQKEARYINAMLLKSTIDIQAICKRREDLKKVFRENTVLNGNISSKITNAINALYDDPHVFSISSEEVAE